MSSPSKVIVIFGATGNQGSSVVHKFIQLPHWHVRCVTRNTYSAAAKALSALGAEVVQANLSSLQEVTQAVQNANAIFLNTDFWGAFAASAVNGGESDPEKAYAAELSYGKNAVMAAAGLPSLERFIYSALVSPRKESMGKYTQALHFESKSTIVDYIENEQPELAKKTSYIYVAVYATSFLIKPTLNSESGKHQFIIPFAKNSRIPIVDEELSIGPFVRALVEDEDARIKLLAYDSYPNMGQIVEMWSRATGKEAEYVQVSADDLQKKAGFALTVRDVLAFVTEFGIMGSMEGVVQPSQLKVKFPEKPYEDWLKENPGKIA